MRTEALLEEPKAAVEPCRTSLSLNLKLGIKYDVLPKHKRTNQRELLSKLLFKFLVLGNDFQNSLSKTDSALHTRLACSPWRLMYSSISLQSAKIELGGTTCVLVAAAHCSTRCLKIAKKVSFSKIASQIALTDRSTLIGQKMV